LKKIENNGTLAPGGGDFEFPFSYHHWLSNFDVRILCCDLRHKDQFSCCRAIQVYLISSFNCYKIPFTSLQGWSKTKTIYQVEFWIHKAIMI